MRVKYYIEKLTDELPDDVKLVAISKYHPNDVILEAYKAGQRAFGESHVQELLLKQAELPNDIQWHFIGHLQTNKVKFITPFITLIHSVDSLKLLKEIDSQAKRCGRTVDCLLQIYVAQEETKFGFTYPELKSALDSLCPDGRWALDNVRVRGLMCMATNTIDENQIRSEFRYTREVFNEIKERYFPEDKYFKELSMGMSDDYPIAVEEGSTMVRVGSLIFGERNYSQ